jgi:zinc protease
MMSRILGGDAGSRMWMRLREHEGLSYGVGCQVSASAFEDVGWFGGFAIVAPKNLSKAKTSLVDEIQNIANGVDDKELQRVKAAWSKELDTYLSDDAVVTALLARQAFHGRTMEFSAQQRTKVNAVTTADVQRVAKQFLVPGKLLLVDAGDVAKSK